MGAFLTTHWSVVAAAADSSAPVAQAALERLCQAYWAPLYAYLRRRGHKPQEAQDLTQEFFARLLEKRSIEQADPASGRFRTFLLTSLQHFVIDEWRKTTRQKRGGDHMVFSCDAQAAEQLYAADLTDDLTPEKVYERRWAATLVERVLSTLGEEYTAAGKGRLFELLKDSLWGERLSTPYAELAVQIGLTEGALKVAVHRLRRRCRELLRAEVAQTVVRPEEIDEELRHLLVVFSE